MWGTLEKRRTLRFCILILVCRLDLSMGLPVEQPTRFTLNTGDTNSRNVATRLVSNYAPGNALASETQTMATAVVQKSVALNYEPISSVTTQYPPVTNTRPNARETVRLENETAQGFLEKPIPKPIPNVLESFLNPTPLVDGIKEEEKYGNSGDKFIGIGRTLVDGFEKFSNFLNGVVDFPRKTVKTSTQEITDFLNKIGARLVGLE
ncbi:uncharacterized protein LOC117236809 [Bombus vosnesenskii]|uniref:Uncharacterized protein LOC117236809 n=1 Tax=Bombus vosnesenskii TaxID=207650 RepID=A0A6J3KVU5_9HYME|nr:uncharacterized protein LOC117236809 [Bombus vosnesenskii]